jgi:deoxyhypusine synthase
LVQVKPVLSSWAVTAPEKEGSLSGCTLGEAVTWGKCRSAKEDDLVLIWSEHGVTFPIITVFVLDNCSKKEPPGIINRMGGLIKNLEKARSR